MKKYPTIPREIRKGIPIYGFDKLDGSNIRIEWSKKNSFHKFGSRKQLLSDDNPILKKAESIFLQKYSEDLERIFRKQQWQKAMAFVELWGQNSFAGNHEEDDEYTVTLFDIKKDKKGIILPNEFLKLFSHLDIAKLLYQGNINEDLIRAVKNRELEGMTFEGIVCKASQYKTPGIPLMIKIKSDEWVEKLRKKCAGNQKLFEELL